MSEPIAAPIGRPDLAANDALEGPAAPCTADPELELEGGSASSTAHSRVSRSLRLSGAVLLVASASTFMLQQWGGGHEVLRYLMLMAHTGALAAAGFAVGLGLRESRAARMFFALVLGAVPVHFAVLGGMLQSHYAWDSAPAPAMWDVPSSGAALGVSLLGIGVLALLSRVSMATLVRGHASRLTLTYLALNAFVLLPIRDPGAVGLVVVAFALCWLLADRLCMPRGFAMRTAEGWYVRLLMGAPLLILVGRSLVWYRCDGPFYGLSLLAAGALLFELSRRYLENHSAAGALQQLGTALCLIGWRVLHVDLSYALASMGLKVISLPLFGLVAAALLLLMSACATGVVTRYHRAAAVIAAGCVVSNLLLYWDHQMVHAAGLICLVVGLATVAYAVYTRQKLSLALGLVAASLALFRLLAAAITVEHFVHWGTLGVLGVLLIVAAALFERYAARVRSVAQRYRARLADWQV